jgi:molybdopterin-guanine dinucleotide biosynthesis protein A
MRFAGGRAIAMTNLSTQPYAAVVLAGGLSTRFGGRNKALIEWNGRPLLAHIRQALGDLFREILLVTNTPARFAAWDMTLVTDLLTERSSLTGIQAGLFYADQPMIFVTACDTPLLRPELIQLLMAEVRENTDIVIPQTAEGLEPLCAIYSRRCLEPITRRLERGDYRVRSFFQRMKMRRVAEDKLRRADHDLRSFYNLNTPEDLKRARERFAPSRGQDVPRDKGDPLP